MSENDGKTDGICILSLDSGGPGTYSQLLILKEYMARLSSDLQVDEDDVYPADYFDIMGGVDFGGLVAFMLGHLRMNVNQAIDALFAITADLSFDDSENDIDRERNSTILRDSLETILQERGISPETKMNDPNASSKRSKVVLCAATSANVIHPHVFRTYPSRGSSLNPTIVEALCATMAIQSHFLPVKIGPQRTQKSFVGGPLGANNPTRSLLEEAGKVFGKDRRVSQIISLGCGLPRVFSIKSSERMDVDRILRDITTDCETVANDLASRLSSIDAYLRLNVIRGMESFSMKEWDQLGNIETHTDNYLAMGNVSDSLDSSLRRLQARVGSVTLSQLSQPSNIRIMAKKPPPVSPCFVLREKPWKTMVDHLVISPLSRQKVFPITGMGGCGKTQLVSYFLQEYPTLYTQIIYVDANSSSSIKTDFQTWARTLENGHETDAWEDALRTLNNVPRDERWILILDNADDPGLAINSFLPQDINITILITSRNPNLGILSTTCHLQLGEMMADEALSAMVQAACRSLPLPDEETNSAQSLLKELGFLAVALVQAGTYCLQLSSTVGEDFHPYTFTQYLNLFKSHRADLMRKAGPASLDNYQRGVYTTLDLSYQVLSQQSRDLLHVLSLFYYTDIPFVAFAEAAKNAFEDQWNYHPRDDSHRISISKLKDLLWKDVEWNEFHLQGILQTLRSFSLITVSSRNDYVFLQIHPLIQAWSRDMISVISQPYQAMATQVLTACGSENMTLNRFILPHMIEILSRVERQDMEINDRMAFGRVLWQQGHYHRARKLFHTSLEFMKDSTQAKLRDTITVTLWLARGYSKEGKWAEAEKLQMKVLEQQRRTLGMEHLDTMDAAASLAATYFHQGRWAEAEKLEVEVLEQRRRILGMEHPDSIRAVAWLASTYYRQGRWTESEKLEVGVLEQRRRILGIEHPDTISAAKNLASTYCQQGRFTEAENLEVEVLEQRRRILGIEHPDTLEAATHLAWTYSHQGRWVESERLEAEVLGQRRWLLGMEHPATMKAAASLASIYRQQGRWAESEKLLVEVLEQRRRIMGIEHPGTIKVAASLALTYSRQGRWAEAERLGVKVLEQRTRIMGIEHPDTISAAANLAATYHEQGRWAESERLKVEVLEQRTRILGTEHPDTIYVAANLAKTYRHQRRLAEAEKIEVRVLEQRNRILGMEHPTTIDAAANLAATYSAQGRWDEAATILAPAVHLSVKVIGQEHPDAQLYIKQLASVYDKLGKTKEAEETRSLLIQNASS